MNISMIIAIIVLVIALAGAIYLCYKTMDELTTLQRWHDDLRDRYENTIKKYNAMKRQKDMSHWFSLLRNPNRGKIEIANNEFERYVDGINFAYSAYMSAKMYGDGRICGSYTTYGAGGNKNKAINREPHTREEVEFFFEDKADWLWTYYEFYRDFVKDK